MSQLLDMQPSHCCWSCSLDIRNPLSLLPSHLAQAALLRIFDIKQAAFTMKLLAVWENDEVETLAEDSDDEEEEGEDAPGEWCRNSPGTEGGQGVLGCAQAARGGCAWRLPAVVAHGDAG